MMRVLDLLALLFVGMTPALTYDKTADDALKSLHVSTSFTTVAVSSINTCGFSEANTTKAIQENALIYGGSACNEADAMIAYNLCDLADRLGNITSLFASSRGSHEVSNAEIATDFNAFSAGFYQLFNALDLAQCAFILTQSSCEYAIVFGTPRQIGQINLKTGYENLVGELNLTIKAEVEGANEQQETHFWGTHLLASVMGTSQDVELTACKTVTEIIRGSGGSQMRRDEIGG